jgi:small-conductance mechanosensitive channel
MRIAAALALVAQIALWTTGVIDFWLRRYKRSRVETDPAAVMTVNVFRVSAVVAVWVVAAIVAIDNLGFNVTGLIAGLGIGGVAIALATQNILADLFASLSIVVDKPFVLGDAIMVDDHVGIVEHIGLKTTRLRSVNGEQLIFSNGDLLKSRIRNFKRMTERRALIRLGVTYQTPAETLARIPLLLRAAVEKHEGTRFDRAHFVGFGESAYEIELAYFVTGSDYAAYLDVRQAVNLDVIAAFAAEKIEFAYPTRTLIMATP